LKIAFDQEMKVAFALAFALVFSCVNKLDTAPVTKHRQTKNPPEAKGRIERAAGGKSVGPTATQGCRGMPDTAFAW
jgi:hypothetical protein